MTRPKVVLRVPTVGHKIGDTIEVADAATAEQMVELGQALRAKGGKSSQESGRD